MPSVDHGELWKAGVGILEKLGVPTEDAKLVSSLLREANLMGIDSHGFVQLPRYAGLLRKGAYNPRPNITTLRETLSTALVDGDLGLGQIVGVKAMEMAIRKSHQTGVGLVGISKSGHLGALIHYSVMALEKNMIGAAICIGGLGVAPFGGYKRVMGINPISIAIPGLDERPVLMDFALSQCSAGKISMALRTGKRLPEGYIVNSKGEPTDDPQEYYNDGAILPFGGHKGYCLCLVAELLAGALTGQPFGLDTRRGEEGALMMAIDVSAFSPIDSFRKRVDAHLSNIKGSPRSRGADEIVIPGELELREKQKRLRSGIFLDDQAFREISSLLEELGLDLTLVTSRES